MLILHSQNRWLLYVERKKITPYVSSGSFGSKNAIQMEFYDARFCSIDNFIEIESIRCFYDFLQP